MAGVISFKNDVDWYSAGWVFRGMADGVTERLDESAAAERLKEVLYVAVASGLYYVNIERQIDAEMHGIWRDALAKYIDETVSKGPFEDAPELYDGYATKLKQLLERFAREG